MLFQVPCCHVTHVAVDGPRVPRVVVGASGAVPLPFWISLGSVRVKRAQGGPACGGAGHYTAALGWWGVRGARGGPAARSWWARASDMTIRWLWGSTRDPPRRGR